MKSKPKATPIIPAAFAATVSGVLKDTDNQAWSFAQWRAVPSSPSSPPVYPDGSAVQATQGTLDATGAFSGFLPRTDLIRPLGCTLTLFLFPVTSAPPVAIHNVLTAAAAVDLGAALSPGLAGPRIESGAMVYAYNPVEILNPQHGDGYVNTLSKTTYMFVDTMWVQLNTLSGDVVYTDVPNVFTAPQTIDAALVVNGDVSGANLTITGEFKSPALDIVSSPTPTVQAPNQAQIRTAPPNVIINAPVAAGGGVYLAWDRGTNGVWFGNGAAASVGHMDGAGNFTANGNIFTRGLIDLGPAGAPTTTLDAAGNGTFAGTLLAQTGFHVQGAPPVLPSSLSMLWAGGISYLDSIGANPATQGTFKFRSASSDFSQAKEVLILDAAGNATFAGTITAAADIETPRLYSVSTLTIDANTGSPINFNYYSGSGVEFCNGLHAVVATIDNAGNAHFNGTLSAGGAKTFVIVHPLDASKELVHACIEGPEAAVYYRGEGVTRAGLAWIELPAYFEALTRAERRTVQLTAIFEDTAEELPTLAASMVSKGKFRVRSSTLSARFYWEVKAVRKDVAPLIVERERQAEPVTS
jgi:hypothetical protein